MKKVLFIGAALSMLLACNNPSGKSQESGDSTLTVATSNDEAGKIVFDSDVYDFGSIKEGEVVDHTFKFKNEGKQPVILAQVSASCGCTTPSYTVDPVLPGKEGEIKVSFNSAGQPGVQQKIITISSNAENAVTTVQVKGTVGK
ncbi:MAG: DUF1573 domain-containing protein [Sphingobacterium composti]|uniref:DUF1573 domain-containing protein n=1 Tax=Sphingobacterium composti TaxID=363260 RepID=UPI0013580516|nr:DUF1573 domain-containing protein [Sphingobacterium composti Ten et al. 2007 non Yoo et al. 2007]